MDPNEVLTQLRDLCDCVHQRHSACWADEQEFAEYFTVLDEWLCKGGFLPDAWQRR